MAQGSPVIESFASFGELLKFLRRRERMTQQQLGIAVGYSEGQISRIESNQRVPDAATLRALFVPALHLEDEGQTVARLLELAEAVRASSPVEIDAPPAEPSEKRHNLPAELTSLVGRAAELAEVARLLDLPTTRLLTLTGSGGCGKTRLALRAGRELAIRYPHGAWLVELAPLSEPGLVTQAVINALGLILDPNYPLLDTLLAFLKERETLLILDNCEHLIDAAAELALTLLSHCPRLTVLATSREPLGVPGEVTYHVPSLPVPPLEWAGAPTATAAAQLFLERAASAQPGFALSDGDASSLARICRRLDGIPLAIELAAARVNALPLSLIASRLEDGFAVLGSGGRGRVPRHATLHAAVEWSYDLLSEAERVLLRRLPLFAGGWLLEQAEEVCACGGVEQEEVLDLLVSLVSKSLVVAERQPDGAMRYRLHEIVRQYARQRLKEAGEEDSLRQCFVDCFIRLAERAEPELKGPRQMEWLARLDQEHDNLNEALSMAIAQQDTISAQRLSGALAFYWIYRDRGNEGKHWLEAALALPGPHAGEIPEEIAMYPPQILPARAKALAGLLWLGYLADQPVEHVLAFVGERIYLALGDALGIIHARLLINRPDDLQMRMAQLRDSLPVLVSQGDHWSAAFVSFKLWDWERWVGDFEAGIPYWKDCLTYFRAAGDRVALARVLQDSVWLEWDRGDIRKAYDLTTESFRLLKEVGLFSAIPMSCFYLAYYSAAMGNFAHAYEHFEHGKHYLQRIGASTWIMPYFYAELGRFYFLEGRLPEAQQEIELGIEIIERGPSICGTTEILQWLGLIFLYQDDLKRASRFLEKSLVQAEQEVHHTFLHGPLRALGALRLAQGDLSAARELLSRALSEITRNRTLPDFPETLDHIARLALAEGKPDLAAKILSTSDALSARMEMVRYPVFQPEYERCRAAAREALGDAAFSIAWSEGEAIGSSQNVIEEINALLR